MANTHANDSEGDRSAYATEQTCATCDRSAVRPGFDTCADCAPDTMTEAEAAREALNLVREAVLSDILTAEALRELGASDAFARMVGASVTD